MEIERTSDEEYEDYNEEKQPAHYGLLCFPCIQSKTSGLFTKSLLHEDDCKRETMRKKPKRMNHLSETWDVAKWKVLLQTLRSEQICSRSSRRKLPVLNYTPVDYALNFDDSRPT